MKYIVRRLFQSYPSKSYTLKTNLTFQEAIYVQNHPEMPLRRLRGITKQFGPWFDTIVEQPE